MLAGVGIHAASLEPSRIIYFLRRTSRKKVNRVEHKYDVATALVDGR